MRRAGLALGLCLAGGTIGCGEPAPCDGVAGTCLTLHVTSATVGAVDQLELDLTYGGVHATTTTMPGGGGTVSLPLVTAIELAAPPTPPTPPTAAVTVGVVAAGKRSGNVLGTGAATATVAAGAHGELTIDLGAVAACVAGTLYCGGDKLAGDPATLYQCNAGGVPLARGVCAGGCLVRATVADVCRAVGGACTDGGLYCGGDKLDGDPQTLYRCAAGVGTAPTPCLHACDVRVGRDDACR